MKKLEMLKTLKAVSRMGLAEKEEHRTFLLKALEQRPEEEELYFQLGIYYFSIEDYRNALRNIKKAVILEPSNEELWLVQGYIYENAKKFIHALEAYYFAYRLGSQAALKKLENFVQNRKLLSTLPDDLKAKLAHFEETLC